MKARPVTAPHAATIVRTYNEGIEDRVATFETRLRTPEGILGGFDGVHPSWWLRTVRAKSSHSRSPPLTGSGSATPTSRNFRFTSPGGRGTSRLATAALIDAAKRASFWKLVSRVLPENTLSRAQLRPLSFREDS